MKTAHKSILSSLAVIALALGTALPSFADQDASTDAGRPGRPTQHQPRQGRRFGRRAFKLGVCVGGKLAKEGVTFTRGQRPDQATREKFKAAIKACRAPRRGHTGAAAEDFSSDESSSG